MDTIERLLVRVYSLRTGMNLLGVLLLLLFAFGAWGSTELGGAPGSARAMVVLVPPLVVAMMDLAWRLWRGRAAGKRRFFLPFEGGAALYLPVWIWMLGMPLAAFVIWILNRH